jgi:hypothetical protein
MKTKLFTFYLLVFLLLAGLFQQAIAVPKYTDKKSALRLAGILDKGKFGKYTISSTYVKNASSKKFYVSVVLSDGSAHNWYLNQIYKWSREDRLRLSDNRTLLFLNPRDNRFVVLDKNGFHRMALKANVYTKIYGVDDSLEGRKFSFKVKSFNLISPDESAFGRDKTGSKYRYIIDLFNGSRILLTYEDAYKLTKNKYLQFATQPDQEAFSRAYYVTNIVAHGKGDSRNGVSQFGIEIQFDRTINLKSGQLPYEIYERKRLNRRTGKTINEFIIDVIIPNSEKKIEIDPITNLEYLTDIRIIKNPGFSKRLILRSVFNPMGMDIPPVMYKSGDNAMFVVFFNLVDQTNLSRSTLLEVENRRRAEAKSTREIEITRKLKGNSLYIKAFTIALKIYEEARLINEPMARIEKLLESVKQFEEAALFAKTDKQLFDALTKRNVLREQVIVLSSGYVNSELSKRPGGADTQSLLFILDRAESLTGKERLIRSIERLRDKVMEKR